MAGGQANKMSYTLESFAPDGVPKPAIRTEQAVLLALRN